MNKPAKLLIGLLFILALTGCFGEDYDVGLPTAYLQMEPSRQQSQLTEANISWNSSSGEEEQTIDRVEKFGLSQNETRVQPNQRASLQFQENEDNGGDIWTDPTITAALWKDGKQVSLELNDYLEFRFPAEHGEYALEVNFNDLPNRAQYVGKIVIEETKKQNEITGQLPEFSMTEIPSIVKVNDAEPDGFVFDHEYVQICWNNCGDTNNYNFPDMHAGEVEIGDKILIDWHNMQPQPTAINFFQKDEVLKIDVTNTPLEIAVEENKLGNQYAVEFLWEDGENILGRTMLNFKLK